MVGMQLSQLCVARRHCASFNAPQHETVLTSLRSLHKAMASTHAIARNTAFASALGRANGITIAGPVSLPLRNPFNLPQKLRSGNVSKRLFEVGSSKHQASRNQPTRVSNVFLDPIVLPA
jgi:hypothetical protein